MCQNPVVRTDDKLSETLPLPLYRGAASDDPITPAQKDSDRYRVVYNVAAA